eukprot:275485_1
MKSFLLCNLCWTACKPDTRITASADCRPNTNHIWCEKCVKKCYNYGQCVCKICNKKSPLNNMFEIKNPNPIDFDINQLMGFAPEIVVQIAQRAILFWDYQKSLQFHKSKSHIASNSKKLKELTQKHQSEQLKYQNDLNLTTQKMGKIKAAAIRYSNGFKKVQKNCKKLEADLIEKTRQFDNLKGKYNELLHSRKQRRRSRNSPGKMSSLNSIGSIPSSRSSHSNRNSSPQKALELHIPETIQMDPNNSYGRHTREPGLTVDRYHPNSQPQRQRQHRQERRSSMSHSEDNRRQRRQSMTGFNPNHSNLLQHVPKKDLRTNSRSMDIFDANMALGGMSPGGSQLSGVSGAIPNGMNSPFPGIPAFGSGRSRNSYGFPSIGDGNLRMM